MRTKVAIICAVIASILVIACPMMPQPGHSRDVSGGTEGASPAAGGQVSVAFDDQRGVVVYSNGNGQTFDVAAEEYPGGPISKCVELADFSVKRDF